jgi:hypothetical protein
MSSLLTKRKYSQFLSLSGTSLLESDTFQETPNKKLFLSPTMTQPINISPGNSVSITQANNPNFGDNFQTSEKFKWNKCSEELNGQIAVHHNLKRRDDYIIKCECKLFPSFSLDKSFNFDNKIGFNWHKTWNLPKIRVSVMDKQKEKCVPHNLKENLFVKISACAIWTATNHFTDVGLEGKTLELSLKHETATFERLRFQHTTNTTKQQAKFHIVLSFLLKQNEQDVLIESYISPAIFVNTKAMTITKCDRLKSFFKPFHPAKLDNLCYKEDYTATKLLEDDCVGLFRYLKAFKHKDKVKHLLFLCIRFPQCVTLYYNTSILRDFWEGKRSLEEVILIHLQSILNEIEENYLQESQSKCKKRSKKRTSESKAFIVVFNTKHDFLDTFAFVSQIYKYAKVVSTSRIQLVINSNNLPDEFIPLAHHNVSTAYKRIYQELSMDTTFLPLRESTDATKINPALSTLKLCPREDTNSLSSSTEENVSFPFLSVPISTSASVDENSRSSLEILNKARLQSQTVDQTLFKDDPESINLLSNREENQNFIPIENQLEQLSNYTETNRATEISNIIVDSNADSNPQPFYYGTVGEMNDWNTVLIEDELESLKSHLATLQENLILGRIVLLIIRTLRQSENYFEVFDQPPSLNNLPPIENDSLIFSSVEQSNVVHIIPDYMLPILNEMSAVLNTLWNQQNRS